MPDVVKMDFPDEDLFILQDGDWSQFRSRACEKEPETVEWIRSFDEGSVMWDVGASVGPYTLIAGALGHRVEAFEPFFPSLGHLQQNIWLNQDVVGKRCIAYPYALSREDGIKTVDVAAPIAGTASHGIRESKWQQDFLLRSADSLLLQGPVAQPDHVKIDVDDVEMDVLEGGRAVWRRVQSVMVESERKMIDDVAVILQGAGLNLVDSWKRLGSGKWLNYLFKRA